MCKRKWYQRWAPIRYCSDCHLLPPPLQIYSQIADALEYLHDHQIVHLDVKSPNVLVWHFPSATLGRQDRMGQAGNILLKLADYGISQVSTRKTIKVGNNPVGTPGFIAPEMFGTGKEVSADKVLQHMVAG